MENKTKENGVPEATISLELLARADEAGCRKTFEILGITLFEQYRASRDVPQRVYDASPLKD